MNQRPGRAGILGLLALAAAFWLLRKFVPSLARLFVVLGGIAALGMAALVAAVLFFALRKPKKTVKQQIAENAAAILQNGRSGLMELRRLGMRVRHQQIRQLNEEICGVAGKILKTLKEQPEDIPRTHQFFDYYLPTLGKILTKYVRLEESGVPADSITESAVSCLGDIRTALEKQYANLFENDMLDLSVEMEVLTQICKRDGLLSEEDFRLPDNEQGVTLTL